MNVTAWLSRSFDYIRSQVLMFVFRKPEKTIDAVEPQQEPSPPEAPIERSKRAKRDDIETYGSFYFRGAILDQLDRYFRYLRRMKHSDPEGYALFSEVGAFVLPTYSVVARDMPAYWRAGNRPAFGSICMGLDPEMEKAEQETKRVCPRIIYFQKYSVPPCEIQKTPGVVYAVRAYVDVLYEKKWRELKGGAFMEFAIGVDEHATLHLLNMRKVTTQKLWSKRHKETVRIPQTKWGPPDALRYWWKDRGTDHKDTTIEEFAKNIFMWVVGANEQCNADIRVRASADNVNAVFAIDVKRIPYFFRDRDVAILDSAGRKKKIFHTVRPHERRLSGERKTFVRLHFRGIQDFRWNKYDIRITVPGLHHTDVMEFNVGAIDSDEAEKEGQYIPIGELGRAINRHVSGEKLGTVFDQMKTTSVNGPGHTMESE